MSNFTVTVEGNTVYQQRTTEDGSVERITSTCATRHVARVTAATLELQAIGWTTRGPDSASGFRRPLLLPGERMMKPLDGARSDERAQGFTATRGDDMLVVDACAGLPVIVLCERGDTADARRVVEWHLGRLA